MFAFTLKNDFLRLPLEMALGRELLELAHWMFGHIDPPYHVLRLTSC